MICEFTGSCASSSLVLFYSLVVGVSSGANDMAVEQIAKARLRDSNVGICIFRRVRKFIFRIGLLNNRFRFVDIAVVNQSYLEVKGIASH